MHTDRLVDALVAQYAAALSMLRWVLTAAPDALWDNDEHENRTWRIAYHTLWSVRYYLSSSPDAFTLWAGAIKGAESLGGSWEEGGAVVVEGVHTPGELVAFLDTLVSQLPDAVAACPLDGASGFEWYPFTRLELHLNTLRHVQHHTGQLTERLRLHGVQGSPWVSGASSWG